MAAKKYLEIRWHGRGGMGAKTGALLLGESMMQEGKYIQAFPEYGPERRGAPVTAYNRISDEPIRIHFAIKIPDVIMVLDPTLLATEKVWEGVNENTIMIVNTKKSADELAKKYNVKNKIFTVDASGISEEIIGRNLPNTPMLGALIKATSIIELNRFLTSVEKRLEIKYKNDIVKANIEAVKKAYQEVR